MIKIKEKSHKGEKT